MKYENIEYEDDKDNPGSVYELENTVNGMKYIGETSKPLKWYLHKEYVVGKGKGRGEGNGGMSDAIKEFGHEVFIARRIFRAATKGERLDKEAKTIMEKNTILNGYNRVARGGGISKHHPSSIEKMKENGRKRGDPHKNKTPEEREAIYKKAAETQRGPGNPNRGKPAHNRGKKASPQAIQNMSNAKKGEKHNNWGKTSGMKGKHLSPEARKKISDANKGENNANYGKPMAEEQKQKISKKLLGRPTWNKGISPSEETKSKISKTLTGTTLSPERIAKREATKAARSPEEKAETSRKQSIARKGKPGKKGAKFSEEAKQQMSIDRQGEKNNFFGKKHTAETSQKMKDAWVIRKRKKLEDTIKQFQAEGTRLPTNTSTAGTPSPGEIGNNTNKASIDENVPDGSI